MNKKLLIITIKSDEMDQSQIDSLRDQLKGQLPNHTVAVIGVSSNESVEIAEFDCGYTQAN